MEATHVPAALKEIADERARLREEIRSLQERENVLARAEAGLRLLVPSDEPRPELPEMPTSHRASLNGYPKTTDAVLTVLKAREGRRITARGITHQAQAEGLLNPDLKRPYGTILEAAKRLALRDQRITRRHFQGKVWFAYKSPASQKAGEPAASDE